MSFVLFFGISMMISATQTCFMNPMHDITSIEYKFKAFEQEIDNIKDVAIKKLNNMETDLEEMHVNAAQEMWKDFVVQIKELGMRIVNNISLNCFMNDDILRQELSKIIMNVWNKVEMMGIKDVGNYILRFQKTSDNLMYSVFMKLRELQSHTSHRNNVYKERGVKSTKYKRKKLGWFPEIDD